MTKNWVPAALLKKLLASLLVIVNRADRGYLCLLPVDCQNFMNARGRPGPPANCLTKSPIAANIKRNDAPAVMTWREKIPFTVREALVMAILSIQKRIVAVMVDKKQQLCCSLVMQILPMYDFPPLLYHYFRPKLWCHSSALLSSL
jgi:hypothetical protein